VASFAAFLIYPVDLLPSPMRDGPADTQRCLQPQSSDPQEKPETDGG